MDKYALIDGEGRVVNIIKWDGKSVVSFGEGITAEPLTDAHLQSFTAASVASRTIQSVTRAQGRLALHRAGLLEQLEAVIASADIEARIWYEDAQEWERGHPVVIAIGAAIGLTPEQIDQLFLSVV